MKSLWSLDIYQNWFIYFLAWIYSLIEKCIYFKHLRPCKLWQRVLNPSSVTSQQLLFSYQNSEIFIFTFLNQERFWLDSSTFRRNERELWAHRRWDYWTFWNIEHSINNSNSLRPKIEINILYWHTFFQIAGQIFYAFTCYCTAKKVGKNSSNPLGKNLLRST